MSDRTGLVRIVILQESELRKLGALVEQFWRVHDIPDSTPVQVSTAAFDALEAARVALYGIAETKDTIVMLSSAELRELGSDPSPAPRTEGRG